MKNAIELVGAFNDESEVLWFAYKHGYIRKWWLAYTGGLSPYIIDTKPPEFKHTRITGERVWILYREEKKADK